MLLWLILFFIYKDPYKYQFHLILTLTIAHYTKTNVLIVYPIIVFALWLDWKNISRKKFIQMISVLVVPVVLALPWYIRNYVLYDSFLLLSGSSWHFVSDISSSLVRVLRAPYSFMGRFHYDNPKQVLSYFNIIQYLWLLTSVSIGFMQIKSGNKSRTKLLIYVTILVMVGAYLYLAIPTGFTEGRLLFPALPAIIYFLSQGMFYFQRRFTYESYGSLRILILISVAPFLVGFWDAF
jgi:4-amino-4-deoxy-L-arabinose transferase-like glycosyltransferase